MPFMTVCTHKGCNKQMDPYLDPKTNKVYCSSCDQELTNLTHFAKSQMKTLKQFKQKTTTSFSVKCQKCSKEERPILSQQNVICPFCKTPHQHLSPHFKLMLQDLLKKVSQDI